MMIVCVWCVVILTKESGISDLRRLTNISLHRALQKCVFFARLSPIALVASTPKLFPLSLRVVSSSHWSISLIMSATMEGKGGEVRGKDLSNMANRIRDVV